MSKLRCIIIEDEPLAVKVLADYISEVPFLDLKASFKDAILATEFLRMEQVELIFLDIHLPKLRGMDFLKTLSSPPSIIITTAYHQYAVEGFELNVTDYLLKPFDFQRFMVAVSKVKSTNIQHQAPGEQKDSVFLNIQKMKVRILFSEILYVESQREYIKVVTAKKEYLSKLGTQDIEAMLPPKLFRRVHRSFIVAINKIDSYNAEMLEVGGAQIPIGRAYRDVTEEF
ncbi:MAG: response regulator transcription factor [Sphingobacteriales bacterium]|nr:MAG: response regulator transcription factor [Sphingobacteriales bacterium]